MENAQNTKTSAAGARPGGAPNVEVIAGRSTGAQRVWVEIPGEDSQDTAWAYSDRQSYQPGDTVRLYVSSTEPDVTARITRDPNPGAWEFEESLTARFQPVPHNAYEVGCDWAETLSVRIPSDAPAGAYLVEITGRESGRVLGHHLFVVRPARPTPDALVLVLATCTWAAYNDFAGASHYYGLCPDTTRGRSPILSPNRPWARGQIWLPDGAPRVVSETRPTRPLPVRYHAAEWAYLNNYSKYYASAGWATYERNFVRWAEDAGYTVDIITQYDLHFEAGVLNDYQCAVFIGHDEYWSAQMRDAVDSYVDQGGHAARFAGNFMWQIRVDSDTRQQTAYKYDARVTDPIVQSGDTSRMTGSWEDPWVGRPGAQTFGVNAQRGMYASFGGMAPRAARGYTVFREDHWAFDGTGLGYADMFGDEASIFGFEMDGVEYEIRDGLPYPTGTDDAPAGLEILAMNFSTSVEQGLDKYRDTLMLGDGDARYRADILDGDSSPENIKRHSRLAGMVVSFTRGSGEVFSAATCEWVHGLMTHDNYVEQVTHNVLERFLRVN